MLETILPKEDFVKYIEHIKNVMAYQEGFNKLLDKHNVVGYFYYPDCATELLSLMHKIFGDADQGNCIENFCLKRISETRIYLSYLLINMEIQSV